MKKLYNNRIISLFIIIQPLIDVLTYFSNLKFGFSVGLILRGLFLVYAVLYLILFSRNKKLNLIFVFIFLTYIFLYLLIDCKDIGVFIFKIPSLFKFLYFPIITLFLYESYNIKLKNKFLIAISSICLFMLVSQIFGNVVLSYESAKLGNSGWFFSSNEFSAICSVLFPLAFSYFIENINKFGFIIAMLLCITMLLIGTKTAFLAIPITLIGYIIFFAYKIFIKKGNYKKQIFITIICLAVFALITPFTYAYKNIYLQNAQNFNDLILNGRDKIAYNNLTNFSDVANQFNFVMGIKINSKVDYEFERDFYNIYYNYGILGFLVYFIVPLYILISNFIYINKLKKINLNCTKYAACISLLITIGVAYISGHTLLSPAVCIYISLILLVLIDDNNKNIKKKVLFISSVGGHLTQMLELKSVFKNYDYLLVTEKTDVTINMKNKYNMKFLIYGSRKYLFKYIFVFLFNIIKSFYLFVKYTPDVIVTTGTHTAVPMCYIGWLFNKKVIYIESFAKRTSPTLTGRIVYPIASVFVVQWKSMLKFYPRAQYWGGIY